VGGDGVVRGGTVGDAQAGEGEAFEGRLADERVGSVWRREMGGKFRSKGAGVLRGQKRLA
jgi:hypothetical protein